MKFPKIPKKHRQAAAWAAVAIAAALVAVGTSLFVTLRHSGRNDPASILPANETIALVRHANAEVMGRLNEYVTGFDGIPLPDHAVDIALLKLPNGNTAWAIFDAVTAPLGSRFSITASDAAAQSLIGNGEGRLSDDAAYGNLTGVSGDNASGAYLKFPDIVLRDTNPVATLLQPTSPAALLFEAERTRIVLPSSGVQNLGWGTNDVPSAFDSPSVVLAANDIGILAELSDVLSADIRLLFQSTMRTLLGGLFGERISPAFDLLPLVRTSFSLQENGAKVLVAGNADNAQDARKTITRLHEAFASNLPGIEVISRPLDDQFSYTGIRKAEGSAERTTERLNGYDLEKSAHRSASGSFVTAIRGTSVLLSNDEATMRKAISSSFVPVADGSVASFSADRAQATELWKAYLPLPTPFANDETARIGWSVQAGGSNLIVDIPR